MCVSCLVVSVFTFMVPVSDAPPTAVVQPITTLDTRDVQLNSMPRIAAAQREIQSTIEQLPSSAEAGILRSGLKTFVARLSLAKTEQQAQAILDEETDKLAVAVKKAPNAQQLIDIMLDIRERNYSPEKGLENDSGLIEIQSSANPLRRQASSLAMHLSRMNTGLKLQHYSGWLS